MTKEEILKYVSETPHNTNPNMIGNMIDALTAQSGSGLPDPSEASAGDVLSLDEDKKPTWSAPSRGGLNILEWDAIPAKTATVDGYTFDSSINDLIIMGQGIDCGNYKFVDEFPQLPIVLHSQGDPAPTQTVDAYFMPSIIFTVTIADGGTAGGGGFYIANGQAMALVGSDSSNQKFLVLSSSELGYVTK